jgi:hypothetical protein
MSALVVALAAGVGVPTGIIAVSTHFMAVHPWWSLVTTLAFIVVVFVLYERAKLWQRLEGPLLNALAERVKLLKTVSTRASGELTDPQEGWRLRRANTTIVAGDRSCVSSLLSN